MNRKLDVGSAWNDAQALLKSHAEIATILFGLFAMLPTIALNLFLPEPASTPDMTIAQMFAALGQWLQDNWFWFAGMLIANSIGTIALLLVVLNKERPTVGRALQMAIMLLPVTFLTGLIEGVALAAGLLLLVLPAIYLAIKFSMASPVIAAEGLRNPVQILGRSWQLTKGNSLSIFGLFFLVGIAGLIINFAIYLIIGLILGMLLPAASALTITTIVDGVLQTILAAVMFFVNLAVYRQLAAE